MVFKPQESVRTKIKLGQLMTWQLALVLAIWLVIVATLLRVNNVQMVQRRNAVIAADESGEEQAMLKALSDLQHYTAKHMNTSTGKFYLEKQYERDTKKAAQKAEEEAKNNQHGNVYKKAADACDPHYTLYSQPYFTCILQELDKYDPSSQSDQVSFKLPDAALYSKEFTSPRLTFDWAGLSVLVSLALIVVIIGRLFFSFMLTLVVKIKEKQD